MFLIGGEGTEPFGITAGPADEDLVDAGDVAEAAMDPGVVAGTIAFVRGNGPPPALVAGIEPDISAHGHATVTIDEAQGDGVTVFWGDVFEQVQWTIAVDDDDIDITVVIQVAKGGASAGGQQGLGGSGVGHDFELVEGLAAQEQVRFDVGLVWVEVGYPAFYAAIGHVEIEEAVVVEIEETDAETG